METLGKRISALRREKGLKQDDLAETLGVSPQAVSKWENDMTCPDITLLPQLAKVLGVSVDALLSGEEKEPDVKLLEPDRKKDISDMILRIVVCSSDGDSVKVNLPMGLVKAGIEMGMQMPEIGGGDALKNIDLKQLLEAAESGAVGNLVEVESADGDIVKIFVE